MSDSFSYAVENRVQVYENAKDQPKKNGITVFVDNLEDYVSKVTQYDEISNIATLIATGLKAETDNPEAANLRKDLLAFSRNALNKANELSQKVVAEAKNNNQNEEIAVNEVGLDPELQQMKESFRSMTDRVKDFVVKNPQSPGAQKVVEKTANVLGTDAKEILAYQPSSGVNLQGRKNYITALRNYITATLRQADNQFIMVSAEGTTGEARCANALNRLQIGFGGTKNPAFKDYPPLTDDDILKLRSQNGLNQYLQKVDTFMEKTFPNEDPKTIDQISKMTHFVNQRTEYARSLENSELSFKEIEQVVEDTSIPWEKRQDYLRFVDRGLKNIQSVKLEYDDLNNHLGSSKDALDWLNNVGKEITKKQIKGAQKQAVANRLKGVSVEAWERYRIHEATSTLVDRQDSGYAAARYLFDEGEKLLRNPLTTQSKGELEAYATQLVNTVMTNNKDGRLNEWDQQLLKAGFGVLEVIEPQKIAKICEDNGISYTSKGVEPIGQNKLINDLSDNMASLKQTVNNADPTLLISSSQFKAYKKSVSEANSLAQQFEAKRYEGGKIQYNEVKALLKAADKMETCAADYAEYKVDALGGKKPNQTEMRRLQAAERGGAEAYRIRKSVREFTIETVAKQGDGKILEAVERQVQDTATVGKHELAEMLYLQNVRKIYEDNPQKITMKDALSYDTMQDAVAQLERSPAFKKAVENIPEGLTGEQAQNAVYAEYMKQGAAAQQQAPAQQAEELAAQRQAQQLQQPQQPQMAGPGHM